MRRKRVFKGWAGKSGEWHDKGDFIRVGLMVYRTKGCREEWPPEDWPPVPVRVTIEAVQRGKDVAK